MYIYWYRKIVRGRCGHDRMCVYIYWYRKIVRGRCGHDRMVIGFTTTNAISSYHH